MSRTLFLPRSSARGVVGLSVYLPACRAVGVRTGSAHIFRYPRLFCRTVVMVGGGGTAEEKKPKGESVPHLERTAGEPREKSLIPVVIQRVDRVNDQIRLFRLGLPASAQPVKFLPGQWLDVYCPGIAKAGGFTLTSSPSTALPRNAPATTGHGSSAESNSTDNGIGRGYLELAVQRSPDNPPAAWLWQDQDAPDHVTSGGEHRSSSTDSDTSSAVIGRELQVRIGGSFTWPPPPTVDVASLRKVVFVAGGVGVNPLMSMLSYLAEGPSGVDGVRNHQFEVEFLYSVKDPAGGGVSGSKKAMGEQRRGEEVLFLDRIARVFEEGHVKGRLRLFLTGLATGDGTNGEVVCADAGIKIPFEKRRITVDDVASVIQSTDGPSAAKDAAVVYICGVPSMTDEFVRQLTDPEGVGMARDRVLCEKWW
ncbi:uncharacterized protein B0I36DRAFT_320091 [Microdochium trichocladiopsis]|uniref:FAD-binding FR-type domain-containing protein n=1 Tax=Microdochium trichocladiopsis TaxID=1682393 RepID=A0A9P9BV02_9PEZI|nr:uncharacterized protein B0I36DRAFT_320091 [Microdochium trichocladiopsis]KAH7032817.1 hypothetical protein B0I36DRAFT_320091 [Microdochium trichocladiopsis]